MDYQGTVEIIDNRNRKKIAEAALYITADGRAHFAHKSKRFDYLMEQAVADDVKSFLKTGEFRGVVDEYVEKNKSQTLSYWRFKRADEILIEDTDDDDDNDV